MRTPSLKDISFTHSTVPTSGDNFKTNHAIERQRFPVLLSVSYEPERVGFQITPFPPLVGENKKGVGQSGHPFFNRLQLKSCICPLVGTPSDVFRMKLRFNGRNFALAVKTLYKFHTLVMGYSFDAQPCCRFSHLKCGNFPTVRITDSSHTYFLTPKFDLGVKDESLF